jgi:catecholate siderophore receptor
MGTVKIPRNLRTLIVTNTAGAKDTTPNRTVTAACLVAAASITGAKAQQIPASSTLDARAEKSALDAHAEQQLPGVTIDEPKRTRRPQAKRPSQAQIKAREGLRRAALEAQRARQQATTNADGQRPPDGNPYSDPAAPYKADRLASPKFTEPVLNTPRSITVLTKELLDDKNITALREIGRQTAGITLGFAEGGNAYGDRFFIRGFDARNDIFIDGVRDPNVSIRENFFTEQVEILRGPASSFAGRGTAGGAINIVTKQATDRDFTDFETKFGTDATKRVTLDVNKVLTPTFAVRLDGMWQNANVAERNNIFDDRWGGLAAIKWTPSEVFKVTANYIHTDLNAMPDFGVPYFRPNTLQPGAPATEVGVPRDNFYGFVNRDFLKAQQDIGTVNLAYEFAPNLTVTNKFRDGRSILNYIGTLPEAPNITNANPLLWTVNANPQSRYFVTDTIANQTEAVYKFNTGPWRNTAVSGVELSRDRVSRDAYVGLTSEALPGGFTGTGSLTGVNMFAPQFTFLPFNTTPTLTGNPTITHVDTNSVYVIDTANYQDFVILNGGIRYDHYEVTSANNQGSNSVTSGLVNWNAGIVYKPVPIGSLYAAYATSSNPVGGELDGSSAQYGGLPAFVVGNPNQVFGPEQNKAVEVGTKWELFDRHLLATAALFQTEKDNARESRNVPTLINGVLTNVAIVSAGAAYRVQGIDLGLAGKITDKWSVFAGLVLMHSEVTKSLVPSANPALYPTNVGRPLANIAHQSFNILSKYEINDTYEVGAQATFFSKIYGGTFLAANQGTQIPEHWRFDAFAEAKINKNWKAKVYVDNIFNELYYDALYQSAAPFVFVAPGRAAYLSLQAKY